jgi:glycine cleavage system H protein
MKRDNNSLRFTETHEWVSVEGADIQSDIITVGISEFAAHQLSDITNIDLPKIGDMVKGGKEIAEVETVKAVSDIYSPIEGQITEVNQALLKDPELLTKDPLGDGWLFKIRPADRGQIESLLDYDAYQEKIK